MDPLHFENSIFNDVSSATYTEWPPLKTNIKWNFPCALGAFWTHLKYYMTLTILIVGSRRGVGHCSCCSSATAITWRWDDPAKLAWDLIQTMLLRQLCDAKASLLSSTYTDNVETIEKSPKLWENPTFKCLFLKISSSILWSLMWLKIMFSIF